MPAPHLLVMAGAMMLSLIIPIIALTTAPIITEVSLVLLISHAPVVHIFRFSCFWVEVLHYKSQCSGVVGLDRSGGLFEARLI